MKIQLSETMITLSSLGYNLGFDRVARNSALGCGFIWFLYIYDQTVVNFSFNFHCPRIKNMVSTSSSLDSLAIGLVKEERQSVTPLAT